MHSPFDFLFSHNTYQLFQIIWLKFTVLFACLQVEYTVAKEEITCMLTVFFYKLKFWNKVGAYHLFKKIPSF